MEKTTALRRVLWATVAFAEMGALIAFFLGGTGTLVYEVTGGHSSVVGVELLALAGLATYAALRKTVANPLIWFIVGVEDLLLLFWATRLADRSVSALGKELIAVDMVIILALIVGQVVAIRAYNRQKRTALTLTV